MEEPETFRPKELNGGNRNAGFDEDKHAYRNKRSFEERGLSSLID